MLIFPRKIVVIEGYEPSVVKSRLGLLQTMMKEGYEVHVIAPDGVQTKNTLKEKKIHFHPIDNNRHSTSFLNDIVYFLKLYKK